MPWRRLCIIFPIFSLTQTHVHILHINTATGLRMRWNSKHKALLQGVRKRLTPKLFCRTVQFHRLNFLTFFFFFFLTTEWLQSRVLFFITLCFTFIQWLSLTTGSCWEHLQYFNEGNWATPLNSWKYSLTDKAFWYLCVQKNSIGFTLIFFWSLARGKSY